MTVLRSLAIGVALSAAARSAGAQVGHEPGHSPYHDIHKGHTITATFGHIAGSGGRFGIAPHSGNSYGIRYDIRAGSSVQMGLGFSRANLQRLIVDPFVTLAKRTTGPVDQTVSFAEVNILLNLTGGKSWRRLAPFYRRVLRLGLPERNAGRYQRLRVRPQILPRHQTSGRGSLSPTACTSARRPGPRSGRSSILHPSSRNRRRSRARPTNRTR